MLTVLHVPYTYYPDAVGGTEIYVEQLAAGLRAQDIQSIVVAPGKSDAHYVYNGTPAYRLGVSELIHDLNELYGDGDEKAAQQFDSILIAHKPDVVHLHALTRIVSGRFVEVAHAHDIPVVFTYHTPTVSCMRSELMLWGREPCDGKLEAVRCTSCRLHGFGLPKSVAVLVAHTPQALRRASRTRQGGIWTALRMRDLVVRRHSAFRVLMAQVDLIIALAEWTRLLLLENNVPAEKIQMVPHGLDVGERQETTVMHNPHSLNALRIVALGRLERIKGIDLLVDAFEELPDLAMTLDIYGISQSEPETRYAAQLRRRVARDPRIRLLPPVPHPLVISLLSRYDLLAVPSQWFETGPLVVLEAFAAGIPVIGSNLGGIAEKVRDGVDGLLLSSSDKQAWREAFRRLAHEPVLLEHLRANVRRPRSIEQVSAEHAVMYRTLAQKRSAA